ncbi:MAG: heme exporter protein CcmB [Candidatus Binataceae bacterium]
MAPFAAILRKDLRLELRAGESVLTLVALSLLILVVMVFALDPVGGARDAGTAAGALWVALIFAGTMGATRALAAERENGCLRALLLSPVDRATLFCAKLAAAFIFMAIAEAAAVFVLVLFFNLDFDVRLLRLGPSLGLGALGFAALVTLLAAIAGRLRAGDLLLPLLAVPMFVPALIAGVKGGELALTGAPLAAAAQWLKLLTAFDVLFLSAGYLLFEYAISEE